MFEIGETASGYLNVQLMGLINALKTGNPTQDSILAILVPFFLTSAANGLGKLIYGRDMWRFLLRYRAKTDYKRTITHNTGSNRTVVGQEDSYNFFLIKAIRLYVHRKCDFGLEDLDLELSRLPAHNNSEEKGGRLIPSRGRRHPLPLAMLPLGHMVHQGDTEQNTSSIYEALSACTIIQKPVNDRFHNIGTFDGSPVMYRVTISSSKQSDHVPSVDTITVHLRSIGKDSIDTFVSVAYEWYMSEIRKDQRNDRFLFDVVGGGHRGGSPSFSKFKLGEEKTFDSLFSRQCHSLLSIVDQFQEKSGKYAVPGYPHKLGILLHGPPGTGKTSFIKALANYTKRHIVSVTLPRINTNQELMNVFTNESYENGNRGDGHVMKLGYDRVIFIIEDIDASTKVVQRRANVVSMNSAAGGAPGGEVDDANYTNPEDEEGIPHHNNRMSFPRMAVRGAHPNVFAEPEELRDKLNLTGLLNVLDGVVDTPGRMVIMTTNCPDVLDPALIRPGRIDKMLELSYMLAEDCVAMIEHYYQTKLSSAHKERVQLAVSGSEGEADMKLIPARLEQVAMEEETISAIVAWLEDERKELNSKTIGEEKDGFEELV